MINFKKVILHNFGSYQQAEVDLQDKGFCLVVGKNNCVADNSISNGTGKSTIWSAISYTICGELPNGVHSNLKNINISEDQECYTSVEFSINENDYKITRWISPKSALEIIKNKENISGKTFRESEKKLAEVLPNLTPELISSTIILSQGMPNKLSSFSPSGRKELLEKLTKSNFMIEEIKQKVTERLDTLSKKLREFEDSLLLNKNQLNLNKNQYITLNEDLKKLSELNYDAQLKILESQKLELETKINEIQKNIEFKETTAQQLSKNTISLLEEKSKVANQEQAAYNEAFQKAITLKSEITSNIKQLENEIFRLKSIKDTCPTCGQKIPGVIKPDTSKQEADLVKIKSQLADINGKIEKYNNNHIMYTKQINESFDTDINKAKTEESSIKNEIYQLKYALNNYINSQNTLLSNITRYQVEKDNLTQKITNLKNNIEKLDYSIHQQENLIKITIDNKLDIEAHLAVVKKIDILIKRDFRGYLLENIIKYLDKKVKDFSKVVFNTDQLSIYIDGNNLNISFCGKQFDNLSGGEKQKVDLILQFAIRDLLNKYFNINSNIIVLDEITDFLDKQGTDSIMKLLEKELNTIESVFIISHHQDEFNLPIDSEINIIKSTDGISRIV